MKRSTLAVIATAAVLVVGGGTAYALTTNQEPAPIETVTATPAPDETPGPAPTESTEPLVAEDETETLISDDVEAAYLLDIRARLARIESQIPNATDEQLIAVGYTACELIAAGESGEDTSLIEGETRSIHGYFADSGAILTAAAMSLCPTN